MRYTMPSASEHLSLQNIVAQKLRHSLYWMMAGLFTTALTVFGILTEPTWAQLAYRSSGVIFLIQLGVVFGFSMLAFRASETLLKILIFSYSILTGFTLFILVASYGFSAALDAFLGTLVFFTTFAVLGGVLKYDLTRFRTYLLVDLISLIVTSFLLVFLGASSFTNMLLGYAGVVLFSLFTAYDIQVIKARIVEYAYEDESILDRIALVGALRLYLDFINLFLSFLRIGNSNK